MPNFPLHQGLKSLGVYVEQQARYSWLNPRGSLQTGHTHQETTSLGEIDLKHTLCPNRNTHSSGWNVAQFLQLSTVLEILNPLLGNLSFGNIGFPLASPWMKWGEITALFYVFLFSYYLDEKSDLSLSRLLFQGESAGAIKMSINIILDIKTVV